MLSGVTWNGVALTQLAGSPVAITGGGEIYTYYLVNPAAGTFTLAYNVTSGCSWNAEASVFDNVNTSGPFGTVTSNSGNAATFSDTINTTGADSIIDDFVAYPNGPFTFTGMNGTQLFADTASGCCDDVYGSYLATTTAGSHTLTYTQANGADAWNAETIEIKAASACPPTATVTGTPPTSTPTPLQTNTPLATPTYTQVAEGATLPYTEYQAENGVYTGSTLLGPSRSVLTTNTSTEAAAEASGREAVQLSSTGQYVEWTTSAQCNSIVVRLSVPDSSGGGGSNYTIGVFIDNAATPQLELPVTSKYSWVYGNSWPSGTICGYDKTPSDGYPHHIYDEAHALLGVEVPAGHVIKLMRTSSDTASFYDIDFVDLEDVGAQIGQPANSLNAVTSYGATGNGSTDDTTAVQNCINAAASSGKIAYLPAGTYKISNYLTVPAVTVQGAGMWYTTIHQTSDTSIVRFNLNGTSAEVSDVLLQGEVVNRCDTSEDSALDAGGGSNSLIQRVWTEHTKCGWWAPGESGLTVTGCRFRDTYADGINLNETATNCTVTQCNVRNTGDDSLASWANGGGNNTGITFTYNTVQCPWRANGIGIYGGSGYNISHNYIADTLDYTGIMIGDEFSCDAFGGTNTVQYNYLERCGGYFGADFGAFNVWAQQGAVGGTWNISNLIIDSPTYMGIQFEGGDGISGFNFSSSQITNAATYGIQVMSGTGGSAAFTTTTVTGSGSGSFTNGGSMSITDGAGDNW